MTKQEELKGMLELLNFIEENKSAGYLCQITSNMLEVLVDKYKSTTFDESYSIISADFGCLGSIIIRNITEVREPVVLEYKKDSGQYVDIKCSTRRILWTDYKDIEPYNRQSGLYCSGASFERLGDPIKETEDYREYDAVSEGSGGITFSVTTFSYNDYYGSVRFGLAIKTELVEEFLTELKVIIDK